MISSGLDNNETARRVLVTGGSGFIGTNLVQSLLDSAIEVCSLDIREPQNPDHLSVFRQVDLLDLPSMTAVVREFQPTHVVHLGARTDLDGTTLEDYAANTTGTRNLIDAMSAGTDGAGVERCIFTSTRLVCRNGYYPQRDDEFCPSTVYGESKVLGEQLVSTDESMRGAWCIVRPGSIWGPWFGAPYRDFFRAIARGRYFHIGSASAPKLFGYSGNAVFQLRCLLNAPAAEIDRRVFWLSDYEPIQIAEWANCIAAKLGRSRIRRIPEVGIRLLALAGDVLYACGVRRVPMTSFRLRNMRTDTTGMPLGPMEQLTGPLPVTLERGVEETLAWMGDNGLLPANLHTTGSPDSSRPAP